MKRKRVKWALWLACCCGAGWMAHAHAETGELLRDVERLVEWQRHMHQEQTEWDTQRATVEHSMDLLRREIQLLEQRIADAEQTSDEEAAERIAMEQTRSARERALRQLLPHLDTLERAFPALLREQPEFVHINPLSGHTTLERLRHVLASAAEIHRHDQTLTHTRRLMDVPEAGRLQLDLLYIGLAQAYAVSPDDQFAGHGVWTGESWNWTWNPAWARPIRTALRVHQGDLTPQWITLPIARAEEGATP